MTHDHQEWSDRDRRVDELVAEWDPLGLIARGAPRDEYDCMVRPLVSLLARNASEAEIVEWLQQWFPAHFGLRGPGVELLRAFTRKLERVIGRGE